VFCFFRLTKSQKVRRVSRSETQCGRLKLVRNVANSFPLRKRGIEWGLTMFAVYWSSSSKLNTLNLPKPLFVIEESFIKGKKLLLRQCIKPLFHPILSHLSHDTFIKYKWFRLNQGLKRFRQFFRR